MCRDVKTNQFTGQVIDMTEREILLREQDEQRLRGFRLLDDDFMKMVFDNNIEATELLLNVFFDRYDMKVLSVVSQREIKNPNGRSVRLDIYAEDSEGKKYDIEVQRQDRGAGVRRARFNSSMLDSKLLEAGQSADGLPDSYVIFITENDVRGQGRAIYKFSRMDEDTHELLDDGSHIIYVNGAYKNDGTRIGQLMHDFRCVEAEDMHNKVLADKVKYFKETEGGREEMCKVMEDMRNEAYSYGKMEECVRMALEMLKKKMSFDLVSEISGLPLVEVEKLAESANA